MGDQGNDWMDIGEETGAVWEEIEDIKNMMEENWEKFAKKHSPSRRIYSKTREMQ